MCQQNFSPMKVFKTAFAFFIFSVSLTTFAQAQKNNDVEAVKALLEKETKAFVEIDYKTWADTWSHTSYAFWSYADTTDVNSFSGWKMIDAGFADYFKTAKPSKAKIERVWQEVKVYGDAAYVRFTQNVKDETSRAPQAQVRVLEKIKGKWKIVLVSVVAIEKDNKPQL